jgi:hypothetical protein
MLEKFSIPTTLIVVVKKGVNDSELGEIVDLGLQYKCVRGVTFQPIRSTGRHESFDKNRDQMNLADVRTSLIRTSKSARAQDLIPHPQNPLGVSIGYFLRAPKGMVPVTNRVFKRAATSDESLGKKKDFSTSMYFLPRHDDEHFKYRELFRIAIVSFLDKFSFIREQLNTSNIAVVADSGKIVPLDSYYLDGPASSLIALHTS